MVQVSETGIETDVIKPDSIYSFGYSSHMYQEVVMPGTVQDSQGLGVRGRDPRSVNCRPVLEPLAARHMQCSPSPAWPVPRGCTWVTVHTELPRSMQN